MSINSFGHLFRVTTWGESHGPALGATVDGCPPNVEVSEEMLQVWLDKRRPGQNKNMTQRNEPDAVRILSGVFDGKTTGTPIQLMIENTDQRSKDYGDIAYTFAPVTLISRTTKSTAIAIIAAVGAALPEKQLRALPLVASHAKRSKLLFRDWKSKAT